MVSGMAHGSRPREGQPAQGLRPPPGGGGWGREGLELGWGRRPRARGLYLGVEPRAMSH